MKKQHNSRILFLGAASAVLIILIVSTVMGAVKYIGGQEDEEWSLAGYKMMEYDQDGKPRNALCWKFEYDAQGKKRKAVQYNGDGNISEQYEFDEKGNRIRDVLFYSEEEATVAAAGGDGGIIGFRVSQTVKEYNAEGELTRTVDYGENGDIVSEKMDRIEYDSEGRKIKVTSYSDGRVTSRDEYEYDSKGRKMKKERYISPLDDVAYSWTDYTYDGQGGWKESTLLNNESGWKAGDTVQVSIHDAAEDQQTYCVYDAEGRLLKKEFKKYEYDEYGNLVRAVYGKDSQPSKVEYGLAAAFGREICKAYDFDRDYEKLDGRLYNPVDDMGKVYGIFGLPTKEITAYGDSEFTEWMELNYVYDQSSNLVKAEVIDASYRDFLGGNFIFEYGRRDELEKVIFYDADGNIQLCQEYEYTKK